MPKPRVIDGGFFDDLDIAQLTRDERLLVIAIISKCADDYGRLIAHPAYLRKQAFGYDEDISIDDVRTMRAHILEHCRNVLLYQDNGQEYICLINWDKWQKIRYRIDSKLPPPPSIDGKLPVNSRESDAKVTVNSPRVGLSSVEKGSVELGRADKPPNGAAKPPKPTPDKPTREDQAMWGALIETCHIKRVTSNVRGQLNTLIKWLRGEGYTVGDVRNFALYWESDSWKRENRPMAAKLYSGSEFGAWTDAGKPLRVSGTKGHNSPDNAAISRANNEEASRRLKEMGL